MVLQRASSTSEICNELYGRNIRCRPLRAPRFHARTALECQGFLKPPLVKITQRCLLGLPQRADAKGLATSRVGEEHRKRTPHDYPVNVRNEERACGKHWRQRIRAT